MELQESGEKTTNLVPYGQAPRGPSASREAVERQTTEGMLFEPQAHAPSPREPES